MSEDPSAPVTPPVLPSAAFEPAPTPKSDWPLRVLALVPLIALALLWSNHHLGVGAGHPEAMAAIAAVLPVALGVFAKLLDKAEQDPFFADLRKFLARYVTWFVIFILYLSFSAGTLTWSSVLVLAEEGKDVGAVTLRPLDEASVAPNIVSARDKGEPARFVVATRPFGRSFSLQVDGYLPQVVEIYPLLGLRLRPSRDLRRVPSALLRFSALAIGAWKDSGGAELKVFAIDAKGAERLLASTKEPAWALLLGRAQAIPIALTPDWRGELLIKGVKDADQELHVREWRRPRQLALQAALDVGTKIRVDLINAKKIVVAQAEFFVGREELQDQAVEDLV